MKDKTPEGKPNRRKSKAPKFGHVYCKSCDGALVSDGTKCPVCGMRMLPKRRKK